jgi:hypothetical protein
MPVKMNKRDSLPPRRNRRLERSGYSIVSARVSDGLALSAKSKAAEARTTLSAVIERLLDEWVQGGIQ